MFAIGAAFIHFWIWCDSVMHRNENVLLILMPYHWKRAIHFQVIKSMASKTLLETFLWHFNTSLLFSLETKISYFDLHDLQWVDFHLNKWFAMRKQHSKRHENLKKHNYALIGEWNCLYILLIAARLLGIRLK